jgi:hypothetical protein
MPLGSLGEFLMFLNKSKKKKILLNSLIDLMQ